MKPSEVTYLLTLVASFALALAVVTAVCCYVGHYGDIYREPAPYEISWRTGFPID